MTAQHVIVTGAAGYVGRHVVTALLDAGAEVTAVVRPGRGDRVDERARIAELDLLDPASDLSTLLEPPADALVHLAWEAGFAHNAPQHMLRLSDHFRVLDAFSRAGVGRIAALGTMHEIGRHEGAITAETPTNPLSLYGIAKDALRRAVLAHIAPTTTVQWLRAFYILGDDRQNQSIFTKLLEAAEAGKTTFPFTSGKAQFDFIQVDELGRQIATVALQDEVHGVLNVCSGEPVALGTQVERFIESHGLDIALQYGAYPDRPYDSKVVYGDATEIQALMARS
ncbi:NAD-dependent epimerase/dehydratase family protein [Agrococcus jejuensis]|uniref:dTDP-6-deoxy-L-talose 4-dehydrogenase (NAD+) n=1 Tax=Agrococcus jejuensis TaxID=399736 RepID=A0A1G8FI95_9MICO|nr:NAD(P)-dependent oxidoreductase [Agrococcus jejuensis]SDH81893.1 dTDP-6-deoxy-L-talose 4-dehydrogenase (NAD+) [Agrococcus jejuensis]